MKRLFRKAIALSLVGSCASLLTADSARAKDANLLEILTGFGAKESCSCAFVVEQTDAYCQAFGQQEGYETTIAIDRGAKTATATFATTSRTSRFTDGAGCVLDALP